MAAPGSKPARFRRVRVTRRLVICAACYDIQNERARKFAGRLFWLRMSDDSELTRLLRAWAGGDPAALEELTPQVYDKLRRMAGQLMRGERSGGTIQATALVNEAYLKLIDVRAVEWQHRAHFFAVSAQIMRRILLDRARRRVATKRGGAARHVNLDDLPNLGSERARELVALDDALNTLAQVDERKARTIELRFFGGLSVEETAEVLKVSHDTVLRDWKAARAWLLSELNAKS